MAISEISLEYITIGQRFHFAGEVYVRLDPRFANHNEYSFYMEDIVVLLEKSHPGQMLEFVMRPDATTVNEETGEKDYKMHVMYKDTILKNVSFIDA